MNPTIKIANLLHFLRSVGIKGWKLTDVSALLMLWAVMTEKGEPIQVSDLQKLTGTNPTTIRKAIDRHEADGFVKTSKQKDRRLYVEMTDQGAQFIHSMVKIEQAVTV